MAITICKTHGRAGTVDLPLRLVGLPAHHRSLREIPGP
jgi:hypothetical protein